MCPGGLGTIDACAMCYDPGSEADIMSNVEVVEKINTRGYKLLPICRDCFGNSLLVKTTGNANYS